MEYIVIETGGKQYRVSKGSVIEVEKLVAVKDGRVSFDKVLLLVSGERVEIGKPYLNNISVSGKVLENFKGDKIRVSKFRAKSRYRKTQGHRQNLTRVEIEGIREGQKLPKKTESKNVKS